MNYRTLAPDVANAGADPADLEGIQEGSQELERRTVNASPLGEIRRANLSIASQTIYRHGPLTRQDLMKATGLSRVTILELVTELEEAGIIQTRTPRKGQNGRPPALLEMNETKLMVGAIEINLGYVAVSTSTLGGKTLCTRRVTLKPQQQKPDAVLRVVADIVNSIEGDPGCDGRTLIHVAVACLAIVDTIHGRILGSSALGWGEVAVVDELTRLTRGSITYSVDRLANYAIVAERESGTWPSDAGILMLYGDIGIGGAYQHNADIFHSDRGFGTNFGHITVEFDGRPCYCGRRGCLETYVGVGPLANALGHLRDRTTTSPQVPIQKTLQAAREDGPEVLAELQRQGTWLARGVELIRAAFDPAVVIIGGALAELAPHMKESFRQETARLTADAEQMTTIHASTLGREAVLKGALAVAVETVAREPWLSRSARFRGQ